MLIMLVVVKWVIVDKAAPAVLEAVGQGALMAGKAVTQVVNPFAEALVVAVAVRLATELVVAVLAEIRLLAVRVQAAAAAVAVQAVTLLALVEAVVV
jgi:hypothetical protein